MTSKLSETAISLALRLLFILATMIQARAGDVYINAIAAGKSGAHLAEGNCRVGSAAGAPAALPSTRGFCPEPVAMYMLISYVAAPTPGVFGVLAAATSNTVSQPIELKGDWGISSRTTIESAEDMTVPAGSFSTLLQYKSVISGTQSDSTEATAFVNGTRYLWFAKGVGLVRMRYEHSNGKITEAELLNHSLSGESNDYLPLRKGNRWTYSWKNGYRQEAVIETWDIDSDPEIPNNEPRQRAGGVPEIKAVDSSSVTINLSQDTWLKLPESQQVEFHFPYFLFVPKGIDPTADRHLLVEPNNTGKTSDDFQVHEDAAVRLVRSSYATRMARELGTALLVPVFPRPAARWQAYTHSLDEDTLLITSGALRRVDLQLIEMIRDAQTLLRRNHINVRDKVFMHGYSASGVFANRFPVLHPQIVRAIAAGGINAIPIFPAVQWRGTALPFPVGIADLRELARIEFNERAYKQVSQYLYMGYLDRNDTTLSRDAFSEQHAKLIRGRIGAEMPKRWEVSQSIYRELDIPAQCVTYNGSSHEIKPEMIDDVVKFFRANSDAGFVPIHPHQYPFVEFKELKTAHVNGVYWQGDNRIPEGNRNLFGRKDHFIISIQEWLAGQDHRQLDAFQEKAAFRFLLKAAGREEIQITAEHLRGNCSSGQGAFQGFVVELPASDLAKIVSGVEYTLSPIEQRGEYQWEVNPGVQLVRP